jgi:hypothetical protein
MTLLLNRQAFQLKIPANSPQKSQTYGQVLNLLLNQVNILQINRRSNREIDLLANLSVILLGNLQDSHLDSLESIRLHNLHASLGCDLPVIQQGNPL